MTQRAPHACHPVLFSVLMLLLAAALSLTLRLLVSSVVTFPDGSVVYYGMRITRRLIMTAVFLFIARRQNQPLRLLGLRFDAAAAIACTFLVLINLSVAHFLDARSWSFLPQNVPFVLCLMLDCLSVSVLEEIVFRGLVFGTLLRAWQNKRHGAAYAILTSSVLFGLLHLINLFARPDALPEVLGQVGYTTLIGVLLAAAALRTDGLALCIVTHALYNFVYDYAARLPFSAIDTRYTSLAATITLTAAYAGLALTGLYIFVQAIRTAKAVSPKGKLTDNILSKF